MTIRPVAAAASLALAAVACAEPPRQDRDAAASADSAAGRPAADTSASSPMTVNPAPDRGTPQTPPTLPEDPAQQDSSMPPGPVNPPR